MGLIIKNLTDGSTVTVADGGVALITMQAAGAPGGTSVINGGAGAAQSGIGVSRSLFIQADAATPTFYSAQTVGGVAYGSFTIPNSSYCNAQVTGDLNPIITPAALLSFAANAPAGIYYMQVAIQGPNSNDTCTIELRLLPAFNLPICPALAWMPAGIIDIQVNMDTKAVNSAIMSRQNGLTQASDFTLGIVPTQAGSLVIAGITNINLAILPGPGSCYPAATFANAAPAAIEVGGNPLQQYYTLAGNLRGAEVMQWFQDINDAAHKATPPLPNPDTLQAFAQLTITNAGGKLITQSFPFPILQSLLPS